MICNRLPPYESDNQRPLLQLYQSGGHPLVRDFYHGIEYAEAQARIGAVSESDCSG